MIQKIFIILFLLSNPVFSQNNWFHYDWDAASPAGFGNLCSDLYKFDLEKYNDNLYVGKFYEKFSEDCIADVKSDLLGGNFYKSLGGYDDYLKKILETVIQDTSITKNIRIMIYRDNEWNASMNESGVFRLNLGCLSILNNEAELAMIMGHEFGHFKNQDVIKSYGRVIGSDQTPNNPFYVFDQASLLWHSREDESGADFTAINLLKASAYSLKSGAQVFKYMKRLEIRNEIKYGKEFVLFTDHPDPGNRLKQVKFLSNDSLNTGRKNFVVDSVSFVRLKELCYEESINLGLELNQIDQMIDLTFTRYLFEPENQNNLAVLIECLRRELILDKKNKIGQKSFILSQYQTKSLQKARNLYHGNSPVITSKNYAFLREKTPSILKYLTRGFIDIRREDISKIKATELVDSNKVEFTTNKEAYEYFINKALQINCGKCSLYKCFEARPEKDSLVHFLSKNDLFDINDLLDAKANGFPKFEDAMIVTLPVAYSASNEVIGKSVSNLEEINDQVAKELKIKLRKNVTKLFDLPFKDQHLIAALIEISNAQRGIKLNGITKNYKVNWLETSPELYSFFNRNNVKCLYVCEPRLEQVGKNQIESFFFYKICLPKKHKKSISLKIINKKNFFNKNDHTFISTVTNKFSYFYNTN